MNFKEFLMLESPNDYQSFSGGNVSSLQKAKNQLADAIAGNKKGQVGDAIVADLKARVAKLEGRGKGKAQPLNGRRVAN